MTRLTRPIHDDRPPRPSDGTDCLAELHSEFRQANLGRVSPAAGSGFSTLFPTGVSVCRRRMVAVDRRGGCLARLFRRARQQLLSSVARSASLVYGSSPGSARSTTDHSAACDRRRAAGATHTLPASDHPQAHSLQPDGVQRRSQFSTAASMLTRISPLQTEGNIRVLLVDDSIESQTLMRFYFRIRRTTGDRLGWRASRRDLSDQVDSTSSSLTCTCPGSTASLRPGDPRLGIRPQAILLSRSWR